MVTRLAWQTTDQPPYRFVLLLCSKGDFLDTLRNGCLEVEVFYLAANAPGIQLGEELRLVVLCHEIDRKASWHRGRICFNPDLPIRPGAFE
jgi:hypothetical protein